MREEKLREFEPAVVDGEDVGMEEVARQDTSAARSLRVLAEATEGGTVEHPDGHRLDVIANISRTNSDALRRVVAERRPGLVVEIGMAYGVSTLSILVGMAESGGRLVSIDPYIGWPTGRRVALHQVVRAGCEAMHEHLYIPSHLGLARLIERGERPGLVYIDGAHDYSNVFVDFFLSDELLEPGGVVAFNDAGWPSVFRVIQHVRGTGRYRELEVGLPNIYRGRNPLVTVVRRIRGMTRLDRYFEKVA